MHVWYAMKVLTESSLMSTVDAIGVPRPDLEALVGHKLWLASDRHRVRRALDALMQGSLDHLGISRFPLSAEFVAAWIALVVSPSNHMVAAAWYHNAQASESMLVSDPEVAPIQDGLRADQILELVIAALAEKEQGVGEFHQKLHDAVMAGQMAIADEKGVKLQ